MILNDRVETIIIDCFYTFLQATTVLDRLEEGREGTMNTDIRILKIISFLFFTKFYAENVFKFKR